MENTTNITELLEKMKVADTPRLEEIDNKPKHLRAKLTNKQKYLRVLKGGLIN